MADAGKTVLVSGATGYIGRHLVPTLVKQGFQVRAISRQRQFSHHSNLQWFQADALQQETLEEPLRGVDSAYYLIHSMEPGKGDFAEREQQAAGNFAAVAERAAVRRIIYLSGLGPADAELSHHLRSRRNVARILRQSRVPVTVLRAAIIIGRGGSSFELMYDLVRRLPLMVIPLAIDTRCQPIALQDVLHYLTGCLDQEATSGQTYDIGGPEVLTYHQLLERIARQAGQVNLYLPVIKVPLAVFGRVAALVTNVPASIAVPLLEGLNVEVVCIDQRIHDLLPFPPTPLDEAIRLALANRQAPTGEDH